MAVNADLRPFRRPAWTGTPPPWPGCRRAPVSWPNSGRTVRTSAVLLFRCAREGGGVVEGLPPLHPPRVGCYAGVCSARSQNGVEGELESVAEPCDECITPRSRFQEGGEPAAARHVHLSDGPFRGSRRW